MLGEGMALALKVFCASMGKLKELCAQPGRCGGQLLLVPC